MNYEKILILSELKENLSIKDRILLHLFKGIKKGFDFHY